MCIRDRYTATNFEGALKGNLLAASFNGAITRYKMNETGDNFTEKETLFSGFGATPLDVIALPDSHLYAGTVWAATYGADNITIFDLSTFYRQEKKFKQLKVEGIFHSGIIEYDNNSIFLNLKTSQELFSMKDKISGYVLRSNSQNDMPKVRQQLEENISYPLMMMDWKEKNRALYKWLNVQRWPIVFIFGLISIVAIVNIISAISMIVVDKTRQIGLMSALGMPIKKIRQMFLIKGLVIGFFGALIGIFFALFLALLQNRYKIIKVPEDVYFMNSVPVDVSMVQIIIIFLIVIFVTATVSLWPSNRSTKISPSNALKYE